MTAKINRSMNGESWVKMPRDLLRSDAWRSLSINARRFIDFLLIEQRISRHHTTEMSGASTAFMPTT